MVFVGAGTVFPTRGSFVPVPALGLPKFPDCGLVPGNERDCAIGFIGVRPPACTGVKCPSCLMDCCKLDT